jgi:hypothetical protein
MTSAPMARRGHLAQRADAFYDAVREPARDFTRRRQNYSGVRWPKMVGPPEQMTWRDQTRAALS